MNLAGGNNVRRHATGGDRVGGQRLATSRPGLVERRAGQQTLRHQRHYGLQSSTATAKSKTMCLAEQLKAFKIDNDNEQIVFQEPELFTQGFSIFEEIRRQGKLCDVTLKV